VSESTDNGDQVDLLAGLRDWDWLDAQEFPPLRYAVPGLIPEGFSLLIGPPKAGKSWLALDFLLSVAAGGYALGHISTGRPRRVLYLALEDGHRRMQDRCRKLLGLDDGGRRPTLYHYLTRIEPGTVLATITAFLTAYPDTALVVVDTLGKVMPPAQQGESSYQRDYRVGGALKAVADRHDGLAVVVLHHDRKATAEDFVDSVSGTHGLAGSADTIVVLARKRQSTEGLLKITGRDVTEAEYALVMADGQWTLDGADLAAAAARAAQREESGRYSDTTASVIDFVRSHGPAGVSAKDVADKFGTDAYQYLKRLVDADPPALVKLKRGIYAVPRTLSEVSERQNGNRSLTSTSDTSDGSDTPLDGKQATGRCARCGEPMVVFEPGQTVHPNCDPEGAAA
jgi:hypothetical protein